jgi:hypothetical protein
MNAFVLVSKWQDLFSVFGFFRLRLHAVIAVFSGCVFYIDANVRSVFSNSFFLLGFVGAAEDAARPSDRRTLSFSWHTC